MIVPLPLLDDIAAGKCLPFIGAGFSMNTKLPANSIMPDWPGLTKFLAEIAGIPSGLGGPEVASEYERKFGRVQLIEAIRKALHSDEAEPGVSHLAFAQLPFETIYTTNFDLLLENANSQIKKPYRSLVGELQMPFHGGPLTTNIVKMHGDIRHEEHMIITKEDYQKYLAEYPVISTHLSAMLITRTALFIGYSLSDPDFEHIRDVIRSRLGRFERMSYILQFNQTESKVNKMLSDNLHVVNLKISKKKSKDEKLSELFNQIQEELDLRAGRELRAKKPEIFEHLTQDTFDASTRAPDSSALLTSSSSMCFVLMPFSNQFDLIYREIVKPVVSDAGLVALRADEMFSPGTIMEQIRSAIQQSRICIADLTGLNPNVLYELGIAQTLGKPTVLMTQSIEDVPFDLRHFRHIIYDSSSPKIARNQLSQMIQNVQRFDRLHEARHLVNNGMVRAGVATIGVLLEHSLKHLIVKNGILNSKTGQHLDRKLTLGKMVQMLRQAELIDNNEDKLLQESIGVRNQAVHDLAEPTQEVAHRMLDNVEAFIKKNGEVS